MHFLVYNPMAGRGRARRALVAAEIYMAHHALPYRVLTTTRRSHATELVRELPTDAKVSVIGGDGTAHEVAAACIGTGRTLGVIPSGSGDDWAFALGLDRTDTRNALDRIRRGAVRRVDTGTVNGIPFVNAMGVGFDADVAAHVHGAPSLLRGPAAYLYAVVVAMKDFSLTNAHVEVDGIVVHDGPALLVSAQNGPRTGSSFMFAPNARLDDGLLDIVIAGRFTRLGALAVLPKLSKGLHLDHPEVSLVRGRDVCITWSRSRPFHMEGELAGPAREFHVLVNAGALNVFA